MKQPYIHNAFTDLVFITGPAFITVALVMLFPGVFANDDLLPDYFWVIFVLLIDVSHVYSTLFRTYLDKDVMAKKRTLLTLVPLLSFAVSVIVFSFGSQVFWRCMAYLAVYHFIRQQYGFMKLYSSKDGLPKWKKVIDAWMIHAACLYPILFWHLSPGRQFHWFVADDFFQFNGQQLIPFLQFMDLLIIAAYVVGELYFSFKKRFFNLPRNLIVAGTALSWYMGIVYYNSDLAFTALNITAHGVPYMALVWAKAKKRHKSSRQTFMEGAGMALERFGWPLFIGSLALLAYFEEGLWDALVWRDHPAVFGLFAALPQVHGFEWLCVIVPLLSLPQITHYILDGFIWKSSFEKSLSENS